VLGIVNAREATMITSDRAHALRAELETARVKVVAKLAAKAGPVSPELFVELATIDAMLTMVREEIEARGDNPGWDTTPRAN
jgi:hypothetical protein